MKKVVLFVRVSTETQELESQIEALKNAAFIDGYTDDDFIIVAKKESGVKLKEAEREGLNDLKRAIERNDVDGVYIFELSRLSRDPVTLYSLRDNLFKKEKVQLKCLKPAFTLLEEPDRTKFDTMGALVFSIFGCFAEQEVIEKKERFRRGREQKALEGKYAGGRVPYGYTFDPDQDNLIVIEEEEASVIRTIYDLYEAGYTQPRIALELQQRGIKYHHFAGGNMRAGLRDFSSFFVSHLLKNELLTGRRLKTKGTFERAYPPIITEEQYERCREIANSNNTNYGKVANIYYGKSLIVCPECGSKMYASQTGRFVYRCHHSFGYNYAANPNATPKECSNRTVISINAMDSLLWYLAVELESMYLWGSAMEDVAQFKAKIAVIQEKIDAIQPRLVDIEGKRERILSLFIDGEISKELKTKRIVELDSQKLEIMKHQIEHEKDIAYFKERIEDIMRLYALKGDSAEGVKDDISTLLDVKGKIEKTESDEERSRLIHKHIKQVCFESRTIPYKHKSKWTKSDENHAKYVTVTLFDGTCRYFYLLCNNGNCTKWINSDENGNVLDDVDFEIIQRFVNKRKRVDRKIQKERWEKEFDGMYNPKDLYIRGFEAMAVFLCMSSEEGVRRRYNEGLFEDAITTDEDGVHVMDAAKALEIMKTNKSGWIKKILDNFYKVRKKKQTKKR